MPRHKRLSVSARFHLLFSYRFCPATFVQLNDIIFVKYFTTTLLLLSHCFCFRFGCMFLLSQGAALRELGESPNSPRRGHHRLGGVLTGLGGVLSGLQGVHLGLEEPSGLK